MVLKTLIALASASLAATSFAISPVVPTNAIPLSHECTHTPNNCEKGLVCAGHPWRKTCVTPKHPGMQCRIEPFWVCRSELKCENDVCKIPLRGNCSRHPGQCVMNTVCKRSGKKAVCVPKPIELGEKCDNRRMMKCKKGIVCDKKVCKLPKGADCTENRDECASKLSCDGKGSKKRCIVYKKAGMSCPTRKNFQICEPGLQCQKNKCKIPIGVFCSSSPRNCVAGAVCAGSGKKKMCVPKVANIGQKCGTLKSKMMGDDDEDDEDDDDEDDDNKKVLAVKCARGLVCEKNLCKYRPGAVCNKNRKLCAAGRSCDGKKSVKRCIMYKGPGMRCPARENFWICTPGLKCQRNVCKIPVNKLCTSSPKNCVAGSRCVRVGKHKKCMTRSHW